MNEEAKQQFRKSGKVYIQNNPHKQCPEYSIQQPVSGI